MTYRADAARGLDIVLSWRALAEQRLDHLIELLETGRWRRYYSERVFNENLKEAQAAVETWRDLSTRVASRDNEAVDISWLGHAQSAQPLRERLPDQVRELPPTSAGAATEQQPPDVSVDVSIVAEMGDVAVDKVISALAMEEIARRPLSIDPIAERYPLLRNTL
jgi:uncharacterized repeat protein (TIGR03809 family)